jgi:hypothetical protein
MMKELLGEKDIQKFFENYGTFWGFLYLYL